MALIALISGAGKGTTNYSSMLNIPVQLRGLSEVVDRYDTVLLDQFGGDT